MKWMITALRKAPKWIISVGIIGVCSGLFLLWMVVRRSAAPPIITRQIVPVSLENSVIVGNSVVNYSTGDVVKPWLVGGGNTLPAITRLLPQEKLVLIRGRGSFRAFGFDGQPRDPVSEGGKVLRTFALNDDASLIVFPRDGDLFLGRADWVNSCVVDGRRISESGLFRDDLFLGEWLWAGNEIYTSILARPHMISLEDGKVSTMAIPPTRMIRGLSPDRKLSTFSLAPGEFGIANFASGDLKRFPTVGELKDVCWLTSRRVAVLGAYRRISVFDDEVGKVICNYELKTQIKGFGSTSPDGNKVIVATAEGFWIFDVQGGRFTSLNIPVSRVEWITESELLGSSPASSSEARGLWRFGLEGIGEKVSGYPFDTSFAAHNPVTRLNDGALYVSGGNLWRYWSEDRRIAQLTHVGGMPPTIMQIPE